MLRSFTNPCCLNCRPSRYRYRMGVFVTSWQQGARGEGGQHQWYHVPKSHLILVVPYDSATSSRRSKASCALLMASRKHSRGGALCWRGEKGGNSKRSSSPVGNRGGIAFLLYQIPGSFPMVQSAYCDTQAAMLQCQRPGRGPFATAITSASSALIAIHT